MEFILKGYGRPNLIIRRITNLKKINLEIIDREESVEPSKDVYDLLAVALLESFISDVLENTDLLGGENK